MAITSPRVSQDTASRTPDFREEGRLPLVVGVTGHRTFDASARDPITREVVRFFQELSRQMPNTPVVILSSLAAGADLLVARIARERGFALIVALPLPQDDYLTLANYAPDELTEAHALLRYAEQSVTISETLRLAKQPEAVGEAFAQRAYRLAGAYVAHHSHVLIALWDDEETNPESVTAATIRYKLGGAPEMIAGTLGLLEPVETGYVHHIFAPRPGSSGKRAPGRVTRLYADDVLDSGSASAVYERILRNLDRFNRDIAASARTASFRTRVAASAQGLIGDAAHLLTPDVQAMVGVYAVADILSQRYQREARRRFVTILTLLALAPLSIALYGDWPGADALPSLLLVAAASISGVFAIVGMTRLQGTPQDRYQDYRALAEALRVQFYWRAASLPGSVSRYYLFKEKTELDWIRQALRTMDGPVYRVPSPHAPSSEDRLKRYRLIRDHWLRDQKDWFHRRSEREEKRARQLERSIAGLGIVYTGLAMIAGIWLTSGHSRGTFLPGGLWGLHDVVVLLFDAIALTTAVCQLCVERMAWSSHAREYRKMGQLFERAFTRLGPLLESGKEQEAAEILGIVGREALAENGDWLLLHRERPLESTILG